MGGPLGDIAGGRILGVGMAPQPQEAPLPVLAAHKS